MNMRSVRNLAGELLEADESSLATWSRSLPASTHAAPKMKIASATTSCSSLAPSAGGGSSSGDSIDSQFFACHRTLMGLRHSAEVDASRLKNMYEDARRENEEQKKKAQMQGLEMKKLREERDRAVDKAEYLKEENEALRRRLDKLLSQLSPLPPSENDSTKNAKSSIDDTTEGKVEEEVVLPRRSWHNLLSFDNMAKLNDEMKTQSDDDSSESSEEIRKSNRRCGMSHASQANSSRAKAA